ncbi:cysteine desulfurase [Antricoccus suffuscus]|uniref:Cysteine desulfurase n=1 Tax=Antricoccus suffuscus TaxID=1629062 RepID=A0A2T1A4B4_9ACTN|nr:cysteine desulfurase family protein [Antricoccus suffuscus]PRZ43446.1 cysteine desulfurase [Antricoccus suffuscus]
MNGTEVYLDHAATTVVREEAIEAMSRVMRDVGNASSLHATGRRARRYVEEARESIAEAVGAHPIEIILTSGATEADNLAVKGLHRLRHKENPRRKTLIVSPAEHHAVLDTARWLQSDEGADLAWAEVDRYGAVTSDSLRAAIATAGDTATAVAVMWANNEVGAISDIPALAAMAAVEGVPMHSDAVQAVGVLPIDFAASGLETMAITAHKVGGPQGVGALVARRSFKPTPLLHGGGQERQIRSGTLDVAGAVGFGVAIAAATAEMRNHRERVGVLRERLIARLRTVVPDLDVNGVPENDPGRTLPGILSVSIPGCSGDALLMVLDTNGISVSTGSACTAGVAEPSHVVLAMGGSEERARSTLRISMGRTTTEADLDALVEAFPEAVLRARAAAGVR